MKFFVNKLLSSTDFPELMASYDNTLPYLAAGNHYFDKASHLLNLYDMAQTALERSVVATKYRSVVQMALRKTAELSGLKIRGRDAFEKTEPFLSDRHKARFVEIWDQPTVNELEHDIQDQLASCITTGAKLVPNADLRKLTELNEKVESFNRQLRDSSNAINRMGYVAKRTLAIITEAEQIRAQIIKQRQLLENEVAGSPEHKRIIRQIGKLADQLQAKENLAEAILAEVSKEKRNAFFTYSEQRMTALKGKIAAELELLNARKTIHNQLLQSLRENSDVSQEEADQFAADIPIDANTLTELKKAKYPINRLRADIAEFYMLSNGTIRPFELRNWDGSRAWADPGQLQINSSTKLNKTTLFHEIAHLHENDPVNVAMTNAYLHKRKESQGDGHLHSLNVLTRSRAYSTDEYAYDCGFYHPYCGKYYSSGLTEILPMGIQALANESDMDAILTNDPEHLHFVMGVMTRKTSLEVELRLSQQQDHNRHREFWKQSLELADTMGWQGEPKRVLRSHFAPNEDQIMVSNIKAGGVPVYGIWKIRSSKNSEQTVDRFKVHSNHSGITYEALTIEAAKLTALVDLYEHLVKQKETLIDRPDFIHKKAPHWYTVGMTLPYKSAL